MAAFNQKFFNTGGPGDPRRHYLVPSVDRVPLLRQLVEDGVYFVLYGPVDSGKGTLARELVREIRQDGRFYALYLDLREMGEILEPHVATVFFWELICDSLKQDRCQLLRSVRLEKPKKSPKALRGLLEKLAGSLDRPLVLLLDGVDSLSSSLQGSFLEEIQAGVRQSIPFPHCLGFLCARELKAKSSFSLARELRLCNFSFADIGKLYDEHNVATGQPIEDAAKLRVWDWTEGQPWLVNAVISQAIDFTLHGELKKPISAQVIDEAAQSLLKERPSHFRHLLNSLKEPQVQKIVGEVLTGAHLKRPLFDEGAVMALELGLLSVDADDYLRPACKLYKELMLRVLTEHIVLPRSLKGSFTEDGVLLMSSLVQEFQKYWRKWADIWLNPFREIPGPLTRLAFQVFLGAALENEVSIYHRIAIKSESVILTINYRGKSYPVQLALSTEYLNQVDEISAFMDKLGVLEGWLLSFDLSEVRSLEEKISWKTRTLSAGREIHLAGM
ncbi:MAG: ATP-binding protein [Deltaproteobacteria bacterium]|jgi:hypothetical protein|nr:ATP-binding protein [Deltaproteobacteria bacterium]